MIHITLALCLTADASIGQVKAPAPDRLVKVRAHDEFLQGDQERRQFKRTDLVIDRIVFGLQYHKPDAEFHGHPDKDFSRFPGCYFHPAGPAGIVLRKLDWFPGKANTYAADARLPASLVAQAFGGIHVAQPLGGVAGSLATMWSEPPIAVLGMDAGNLAGYARPLQTFHLIERIPFVYELSVPPKGKEAKFTFLEDAKKRGAEIAVDQGELRTTLEKKNIRGFYHLMFIQPHKDGELTIQKELFTKEGMARCMDAMVEEGILCYHTSSRYFEFPKLVADCADQLGYAVRRGHDMAHYGSGQRGREELGHWTSEWVMVARKPAYLRHLRTPEGYKNQGSDPFWSTPEPSGRYRWTDAGPKSMRGMVRTDPALGSMASAVWEWQETLTKLGLRQQWATSMTESLQGMLNAWGRFVASTRDY